MTKYSYLILNYRSSDDTISLSRSIREFDIVNPIVIVDNFSDDGSLCKLQKLKKKLDIEVIFTKSNLGYAKGNNFGLRHIEKFFSSDYVFICNPDITVNKENVLRLMSLLENDSSASVASLKMLDINKKEQLSTWKLPTFFDDIIMSSTILNKLIKSPVDYGEILNLRYVDVVQGAFFLIRFKDLKKINFFHEETFLYCEERFLGYKLKSINKKIIYDPNFSFLHKIGGSVNKTYSSSYMKFKLLIDSRIIYHKQFSGRFRCFLYKFFSNIFLFEKWVINIFIKLFKI